MFGNSDLKRMFATYIAVL